MTTTISEIYDIEILKNLEGFEFNWWIKSEYNSVVFCAQINKHIVGLVEFTRYERDLFNFMNLIEILPDYRGSTVAGELLAWVGLDSLKNGFDGFVVFESKTVLYQYYIHKYGAKPLLDKRLFFDTETTLKLIKTYLEVENV
ncbi:MAG: hypothetical protein FWG63_04350 [Defluviitaleaceae bacterium]|nr:hypothetical protein [Defluviitaleaceae bacterium]